jgi:hypothetical protein
MVLPAPPDIREPAHAGRYAERARLKYCRIFLNEEEMDG